MSDLDRLIKDVLDDDEQGLLAELEREAGFFERAFGMLTGPSGWVNLMIIIAQAVLFFVGVWLAWQFYQQADVLNALRWGLPALLFLIVGPILKTSLVPVMEANRLARDIRRLELRIERARAEERRG